MKKIIRDAVEELIFGAAGIMFLAMMAGLGGCTVWVGPPAQMYNSGYYNSMPPVYSCPECYTPPIDYRKPRGVWYPWGRIGQNERRERR